MNLFISIINHNHDEMISMNSNLSKLATNYTIIVKSNTVASSMLKEYCNSSSIHLIQGKKTKGFGENNNDVYKFATSKLLMKSEDYFLVLNPDVDVDLNTIQLLLNQASKDSVKIATINLYRDREMTVFDNSIRRYPSILNPIKTLLGIKRTDQYDKSSIKKPTLIDWSAGSFLLVKSDIYRCLEGFDNRYFMYFEDVDFCKRATSNNIDIVYYPQFKGIHLAQHSNRKIFSSHFFNYIKSTIIYFSKHGLLHR